MKSVRTSAFAAVIVAGSAWAGAQDVPADSNGQPVAQAGNDHDDSDFGWIGLLGLAGLLGLKRRDRDPVVREKPRTI
jgi:MYXO-CTERM domain-containing protein